MIIPALDLIEGQVVRLYQGDYGQVTEYKVDPAEQFNLYHQAGANWLHLVDLTGAKDTTARRRRERSATMLDRAGFGLYRE